jgi:hypothetical protein
LQLLIGGAKKISVQAELSTLPFSTVGIFIGTSTGLMN